MKPCLRSLVLGCLTLAAAFTAAAAEKPNIVLIYADDLGYGDLSCYGATQVSTPNLDRLAAAGRRFTQAHATSATCTPSRFALLTGRYPWRRSDAKILPGDAPLLIAPGTHTMASVMRDSGYATAVVGKWHLGLGTGNIDWNGEIKPGPLEIGFDSCFLLPATGDRTPCVYVENHRVVGLDRADPIKVQYTGPIGNEPTGKKNPELLKYRPSHGHDMAIVNGISRIGYMTGGTSALWVDEDMADVFVQRANRFIEQNKAKPFFLFLSTHDIHVPRLPHARFAGKSPLGLRGDVILQFDWTVGQIMETLDRLKLADNTIVIVSSDNGAVVDDGYQDQAVAKLGSHTPNGPLRGGKYSAFEAGTRIPFIVRWPARIKPGVSSALVSQLDLAASFAALTGHKAPAGALPDSRDMSSAFFGADTTKGLDFVVQHALNGRLGVRTADWKYIEPGPGPARNNNTNIELGNSTSPQLYNLSADVGETKNLAAENPRKVEELKALLAKAKGE